EPAAGLEFLREASRPVEDRLPLRPGGDGRLRGEGDGERIPGGGALRGALVDVDVEHVDPPRYGGDADDAGGVVLAAVTGRHLAAHLGGGRLVHRIGGVA